MGSLDIETTGLSPDRSGLILLGTVEDGEEGLFVQQCFADRKGEEKPLLEEAAAAMERLDVVITYNGRHFDIPFLENRAAANGIRLPKHYYSLDLFHIFHHYSPFRKFLPDLKQPTVEKFAGLGEDRTDEISGKESVELYNAYLRNGSKTLKDKILLHNHDDILQLPGLLKLLGKLDLHKILYACGMPAATEAGCCILEKPCLMKKSLRFMGKGKGSTDHKLAYGGLDASYDGATGYFSGAFRLEEEKGYRFVDLEGLPADFSGLSVLPGAYSGYLLVAKGDEPYYENIDRLQQQAVRSLFSA